MPNYSNPRLRAEFNDWPLGGNRRGLCTFFVERHPKRGVRAGRITTGKPKYDTYAPAAAIVDGDDGRTYILVDVRQYGFVKVRRSDFMDQENIFRDNDPERYAALLAMIQAVNPQVTAETL